MPALSWMKHPPYCDHPGCHDSRTGLYMRSSTVTSGNQPYPPRSVTMTFAISGVPWDAPGYHRWCRIHALIHQRWAVG